MMLPTRSILDGATPSRARLASASGDGVHNRSATESVTIRLISSGIVRSKLRSPASRCATGRTNFLATIAAAMVEFTSPTTTTQSGRADKHTPS